MSRWRGRRATAVPDKRNPGPVIFLRRIALRVQPKTRAIHPGGCSLNRATHLIYPYAQFETMHSWFDENP